MELLWTNRSQVAIMFVDGLVLQHQPICNHNTNQHLILSLGVSGSLRVNEVIWDAISGLRTVLITTNQSLSSSYQ